MLICYFLAQKSAHFFEILILVYCISSKAFAMELGRVKELILIGKTYEEISEILKGEAPNARGLSARSVRRFCNENHIDKKNLFGKEQLDETVKKELLKVRIICILEIFDQGEGRVQCTMTYILRWGRYFITIHTYVYHIYKVLVKEDVLGTRLL